MAWYDEPILTITLALISTLVISWVIILPSVFYYLNWREQMAIATIVNSSETFKLESAPPDGFVTVRRMTWGEKLKRQSMMTTFQMQMGTKKTDDMNMTMDMATEQVAIWEFQNLVVDHNLTDENEKLLNFRDVRDIVRLGPIVGEEIQFYINKLNSFEEGEEVKN